MMIRRVILFMIITCLLFCQANAAGNAQVSVTASPAIISSGGTGTIQVVVTYERISFTSDTRDSTFTYPLPDATITLTTTSSGITFSPSSGTTDSQGRFTSTLYVSSSAAGSIPVRAVAEIPGDYYGEGTATVTVEQVPVSETETPYPDANQPPVAFISVDTYAGEVPLTVQFDGQESYDPDGAVTSYAWDFGDGTMGSGYIAIHTYENAGTYAASLTVTDNEELKSDPVMMSIIGKTGTSEAVLVKDKDTLYPECESCVVQPLSEEIPDIAFPLKILQNSGSQQDLKYDLNRDNKITSEDAKMALNELLSNREKRHTNRSCEYTPGAAANYTKEEWDKYCNWQPEPVVQEWAVQFKKSNLQSEIDSVRVKVTSLDLNVLQAKYKAGTLKPTKSLLSELSTLNGMNQAWSVMAKESLTAFPSAYGKTNPEIKRVRDASDLPKDTLPSTYPYQKLAIEKIGSGSLFGNQPSALTGLSQSTEKTEEEKWRDDPALATLRKMGLDYWRVPSDLQNDYIIEGSYAMIEGRDFGTCPQSGEMEKGDNIICNVTLKWQRDNEFFSTDKSAIEENTGTYHLLPATGDWKTSWNNYGIGVWIPHSAELTRSGSMTLEIERKKVSCHYSTECENCPAYKPANVANVLLCSDEPETLTSASRDIYLVKDMPGFSGIYSEPKYWGIDLVNGGELLLTGSNFGNETGTLKLELHSPVEAYDFNEPYQKISPTELLPPDGRQINFTITEWSDNSIRVKLKKINANFDDRGATIYVTKKGTPTPSFTYATFGPEWDVRIISGEKFFTPSGERTEGLAYENVNHILVVSHDPRCADWDIISGTEGDDHFFGNKALPPNVKVTRIFFIEANPDISELQWTMEMLNMEYKLMSFDIRAWVEFIAQCLIMAFDHKAGSYEAEFWGHKYLDTNDYLWVIQGYAGPSGCPDNILYKDEVCEQPKNLAFPKQVIHWENTCLDMSPFDDKNVVYTISFIVEFPAGVDVGE